MIYSYRYECRGKPLSECPECGNDLTREGGITVIYATDSGQVSEGPSSLDEKGNLLDPDRLIGIGNHSATECGGCGEYLFNMEGVEEIDTSTGGEG